MIVDWYQTVTGRRVRYAGRHQRTVRHPERSIVLATPDGYVGSRGLIECKAPGRHTMASWGEPGTDEVPDYYVPQGIWQMAATDRGWVDFAVDLGDQLGVYRVEWDLELFETLFSIAEKFWVDHVLADVPPPTDHTQGCADMLSAIHKKQDNRPELIRDESIEIMGLLSSYRQAKTHLVEAKEAADGLANQLKARIGDGRGYDTPVGKIIWSDVKGRAKTDWRAIATEVNVPEDIIAKHTSIGAGYRALKPYWPKGQS